MNQLSDLASYFCKCRSSLALAILSVKRQPVRAMSLSSGRSDAEGGWPVVDLAPAAETAPPRSPTPPEALPGPVALAPTPLDPPPEPDAAQCQDDLDLTRPCLRDPDPLRPGLKRPAGEPCAGQPGSLLETDPKPAGLGEPGSEEASMRDMGSVEDLEPSPKKMAKIGPDLPDFEELPEVVFEDERKEAEVAVNEAVNEAVPEEEAEALAEGPGADQEDVPADVPPRENLDLADQGWVLRIRYRKSGAQAGHRVLTFIDPDGARYASKAKAQEGGLPDGAFPGHL